MRIERQTRSVPGQLKGPAPQPHQVRSLDLRVEALPTGQLRISTPAARGWAAVVRTQGELSRALSEAFTEAQCAAYARWRGERYELDDLTEPVAGDPMAPARRAPRRNRASGETGYGRNHQRRPDTLSPEAWVKRADGKWVGPAGTAWREDTQMVQRVLARRRAAGLPT
jgi:hypothetical protein